MIPNVDSRLPKRFLSAEVSGNIGRGRLKRKIIWSVRESDCLFSAGL